MRFVKSQRKNNSAAIMVSFFYIFFASKRLYLASSRFSKTQNRYLIDNLIVLCSVFHPQESAFSKKKLAILACHPLMTSVGYRRDCISVAHKWPLREPGDRGGRRSFLYGSREVRKLGKAKGPLAVSQGCVARRGPESGVHGVNAWH